MSQTEVLLAVLGVLVVANVALVASIPFRAGRRRRSLRMAGAVAGSSADQAGHHRPGPAEDARVAAAIEAFVGDSTDAPVRVRPPAPSDAGIVPGLMQSSPSPEWTLADLADPAAWSRSIREESARVARFGHPVTVVMAEVPGLDVLADHFGRGVAERVETEAARLLLSETRAADRIARLDDARFGVLLLETEETAAGDYVERVRTATDRWLESAGLSVRLALGWASTDGGSDVMAAAVDAEQRMHDIDHGSTTEPEAKAHGGRPSKA
jgi:diguanylate cyclase (GGDEF)-like protein